MSLMRVFSGSCMSLDDHDYTLPQLIPRSHVLGPGEDHFDEEGIPQRPQTSCHAINKVFSGSALDLNAMNPDDEDDDDFPATNGRDPNSQHSTSDTSGSAGSDQTLSTILERINTESERQRSVSNRAKVTVLVVGGAGFLGSHIVARLLDAGYTVKSTVSNTSQVKELFKAVPDAHRLTVAEINVRSPMAFRDIIKGCQFVIHCGVPSVSPTENLVDVHSSVVKALFDAIRMYGKSSVKRVVITGSALNVASNEESGHFDETNWNEKAAADVFANAKIHFEREAWRLKELLDIELSVILPSIMIGPSLTCEVSEAMRLLQGLGSQSAWFPFAPNMFWNWVDVRDVADAHIKALEVPAAGEQRFLVSGVCAGLPEIGRLIRKTHPHLSAPTRAAPTLMTLILGPLNGRVGVRYLWRNLGKQRQLDTTKATTHLSFAPLPLEVTVKDAVQELISSGNLPSPNDPNQAGGFPIGAVALLGLVAGGVAAGAFVWRRRQ